MHELSKWISDGVTINYINVIKQTMNYVLHTKERGLCLEPEITFKNLLTDLLIIKGRLDSNYATNQEMYKCPI